MVARWGLMEQLIVYGAALLLCSLIVFFYLWRVRAGEKRVRLAIDEFREAGLTEPPSLHPLIKEERCIGSGACVKACPEKMILGLAGNKAHLVNAAACVGHGACEAACPVSAIDLVFGTSRRGVDIPRLKPDFQTNVGGLYIAGELGGMGLIRNAVTQGRQAAQAIAASLEPQRNREFLDLVIVGAGPAGLSAALQAESVGLNCLTLDQEGPGGAIRHYPRRKLVMTRVMQLPGEDPFPKHEVLKEDLVAYLDEVVSRRMPAIQADSRVTGIEPDGSGFLVRYLRSSREECLRARRVLLAVGRRGSPRRLGIPGEDRPGVIYSLPDPELWAGQHCIVVGGGDSALEAALRLSEQPGSTSTLVYRGEVFTRARPANRAAVELAEQEGRISVHRSSTPLRYTDRQLLIKTSDTEISLEADMICVQIGGELPTALLKHAGIKVDVHFGRQVVEADDRG